MASVLGMNAVLSRTIARNEPRQMYEQSYPYFYNPMWNLYGDEPLGSAPATYYFRGSDPQELYWHMLDQVLLRPALIDDFDTASLRIVTKIGEVELTNSQGIPNRKRFSDHLPVIFTLKLASLEP